MEYYRIRNDLIGFLELNVDKSRHVESFYKSVKKFIKYRLSLHKKSEQFAYYMGNHTILVRDMFPVINLVMVEDFIESSDTTIKIMGATDEISSGDTVFILKNKHGRNFFRDFNDLTLYYFSTNGIAKHKFSKFKKMAPDSGTIKEHRISHSNYYYYLSINNDEIHICIRESIHGTIIYIPVKAHRSRRKKGLISSEIYSLDLNANVGNAFHIIK